MLKLRGKKQKGQGKEDFAAAVAISKVYEDAIKEDEEQYLGSDDPDDPECYHWPASHGLRPQKTFVKEEHSSLRAHDEELLTRTKLQLKETLIPLRRPTTNLEQTSGKRWSSE